MSEKEAIPSAGTVAAIATAVTALARTPLPYLIGMGAMFAGSHWDGHLQNQQGCYQLQVIQGKTWTLNTCTGDVREVPTSESAQKG